MSDNHLLEKKLHHVFYDSLKHEWCNGPFKKMPPIKDEGGLNVFTTDNPFCELLQIEQTYEK